MIGTPLGSFLVPHACPQPRPWNLCRARMERVTSLLPSLRLVLERNALTPCVSVMHLCATLCCSIPALGSIWASAHPCQVELAQSDQPSTPPKRRKPDACDSPEKSGPCLKRLRGKVAEPPEWKLALEETDFVHCACRKPL